MWILELCARHGFGNCISSSSSSSSKEFTFRNLHAHESTSSFRVCRVFLCCSCVDLILLVYFVGVFFLRLFFLVVRLFVVDLACALVQKYSKLNSVSWRCRRCRRRHCYFYVLNVERNMLRILFFCCENLLIVLPRLSFVTLFARVDFVVCTRGHFTEPTSNTVL